MSDDATRSHVCGYCERPECRCTATAHQHGRLGSGCTCGNATPDRAAELDATRKGAIKVIENERDGAKIAIALIYVGDCIRALAELAGTRV